MKPVKTTVWDPVEYLEMALQKLRPARARGLKLGFSANCSPTIQAVFSARFGWFILEGFTNARIVW
jgi:hypothetical protein